MINKSYIDSMVDSSNCPGDANTHEYVDRITACNIPNSIISSFLVHSGGFAGECVGERRTKSYKGYGSNLNNCM